MSDQVGPWHAPAYPSISHMCTAKLCDLRCNTRTETGCTEKDFVQTQTEFLIFSSDTQWRMPALPGELPDPQAPSTGLMVSPNTDAIRGRAPLGLQSDPGGLRRQTPWEVQLTCRAKRT